MEVTLEKYQEINDSFKGKSLVFHIGSDAGFYSELIMAGPIIFYRFVRK